MLISLEYPLEFHFNHSKINPAGSASALLLFLACWLQKATCTLCTTELACISGSWSTCSATKLVTSGMLTEVKTVKVRADQPTASSPLSSPPPSSSASPIPPAIKLLLLSPPRPVIVYKRGRLWSEVLSQCWAGHLPSSPVLVYPEPEQP